MLKAKVTVRRLITAGGTLLCAWGVGHFMQMTAQTNPGIAPSSSSLQTPATETSGEQAKSADDTAIRGPQQPVLENVSIFSEPSSLVLSWTSAGYAPASVGPAPLAPPQIASSAISLIDNPSAMPATSQIARTTLEAESFGAACDVRLTAEKSLAAMALLTLDAPCLTDAHFTVHHSGMMFSDVTDSDGRWVMQVPALSEQAIFIVSFEAGDSAVASTTIDTVPLYDRYVLQWQGPGALEIHAFESGADQGEFGHVWVGAARDYSVAVHGEGGFIVSLGSSDLSPQEDVRIAQVYTAASIVDPSLREIEMNAETTINDANCGREIEAQVLVQEAGKGLSAHDFVFAMPNCTETGAFVLLKNLDNEMKIAAN